MAETKEKTAKTKAPKVSFPKETYLEWYRSMQLMRKFEEKAGQLYGQQKIKGFCHLYIGQEACVAGAVSALTKDDKWITAYRDHAHPLALRTTILENNFATEEDLEQIDNEIKQVVEESVEFAENSPYPEPEELYTDIYVQKDYPYIMD